MSDEFTAGREAGTMVQEAILAGRQIAEAGIEPQVYVDGNKLPGAPFVVLGGRVCPLPEECRAKEKAFNIPFVNVSDFAGFVGRFKDERTQIFMDENRVLAIFDFHRPDALYGPVSAATPVEFCRQRASLKLEPDEMTAAWLAHLKKGAKPFDQVEFAEFLEDQRINIVSPEAAVMIEIARTLQATKKGEFQSGIRLENGDRTLKWTSKTTATAGERGELEIPSKITVRMQFVKGGDRVDVQLGLRYRIDDGVVVFGLTAPGLDLVLQCYSDAIADRITKAVSLPVYRVDYCP